MKLFPLVKIVVNHFKQNVMWTNWGLKLTSYILKRTHKCFLREIRNTLLQNFSLLLKQDIFQWFQSFNSSWEYWSKMNSIIFSLGIYPFKANNRNTRKTNEICSTLTKKTAVRFQCRCPSVFIVNFGGFFALIWCLCCSLWKVNVNVISTQFVRKFTWTTERLEV